MRKFLSLENGTFIKVDEIEAVEEIASGARIYTKNRVYESSIPTKTLLSIIESYKYEPSKQYVAL